MLDNNTIILYNNTCKEQRDRQGKVVIRMRELMTRVAKTVVLVGVGIVIGRHATVQTDTQPKAHTYTKTATVTRVRDNNVCYLTDLSGNVWCIEDDTLTLYTTVNIELSDNATLDTIEDDVIVNVY